MIFPIFVALLICVMFALVFMLLSRGMSNDELPSHRLFDVWIVRRFIGGSWVRLKSTGYWHHADVIWVLAPEDDTWFIRIGNIGFHETNIDVRAFEA